ncbi:MAG: flagellar basal-body rod protein FlgF [Deferribacteraceae bacterium]|jgi:flagellar basal-body rod protein FlgG|nr:flagellar basal-body rod protein FlgF [Deferribacteraceae bacterium]
MQNGLYVAASGLLMQEARVSAISNNLANINTAGYKRDLPVFSEYRPIDRRMPQNLIQKSLYNKTINSSVKLDEISVNQTAGPLKETGNKFDLALENPKQFFAVETPWGIRYTRDGEFTLNAEGQLVTHDGFYLLDRATGAPIVVPANAGQPNITPDGAIYVNNAPIGEIDIAAFTETEKLQKVGRNLFSAVGILPEIPENIKLSQGFVEMSNVNPILEMVRMVDALRGFEMYQKMVQTYDSLNDKAANDIARM